MQTLPREDFPTPPEASKTPTATLSRASLKEMVGKTQFAITGEDTRFFLNGALFILRPDGMSLAATDGHRLALVTTRLATARAPRTNPKSEGDSPEENARRTGPAADRRRRRHPLRTRARTICSSSVGGRLLISRMIDGQFPGLRAGDSQGQRQAHRIRPGPG